MDAYTAGLREAAFEYGIKKLAYQLDMSESRLYLSRVCTRSSIPMAAYR